MPDCRDEGAVAGLFIRRGEALLHLEAARLMHTACLIRGGLRLVLDIGTTRLMSWFSELVRVRTDLDPPDGETVFGLTGFFPAVRTLEVGKLLLGSLDEVAGSAFTLVEEAAFVFLLVESLEATLFLILFSVDCFGIVTPPLFLSMDTSASASS